MARYIVPLHTPSLEGTGQLAWQDQAACTQHDPRIWDETSTQGKAISICGGCPVLDECRDWALGPGYDLTYSHTILAGLTPADRQRQVGLASGELRLCMHCQKPLPRTFHKTRKLHSACRNQRKWALESGRARPGEASPLGPDRA